ncbi:MAG TPA: hypothetical protein P5280_03860, partial [Cyclobacteriaceae bacterium]|nr:hypothetical protein [Cyclobacteriaceae bacterium]
MTNNSHSYIIGTGWWCTDEDEKIKLKERKFLGSDSIRGRDFHLLWYESICRNTSPRKILIVDSNSPLHPNLNIDDNRIEFLSLPFNAGHSTNHIGKWAGWTRSVILGLQYAQVADVDYFVYVEQDALLKGQGIIEYCITRMKTPYMFGCGQGTPQILQQSFFIIHRNAINHFLTRLVAMRDADSQLCPEDKFAIATSQVLTTMSPMLKKLSTYRRWRLIRLLSRYDHLPLGYGRTRPIDFSDKYFYFQHGTDEEIAKAVLDLMERAR